MITLTPAYGRDYRSKREAVEAFKSGADFILNSFTSQFDGKPCSIRDFSPGDAVKVRYNNLTRVAVVTVSE